MHKADCRGRIVFGRTPCPSVASDASVAVSHMGNSFMVLSFLMREKHLIYTQPGASLSKHFSLFAVYARLLKYLITSLQRSCAFASSGRSSPTDGLASPGMGR